MDDWMRFFSAELFLILISSLISRSVSGSVQTVNATATAIVSAESTVHPLVFNCSELNEQIQTLVSRVKATVCSLFNCTS
ncbi:hypothetical protein ES288_D02G240300v1 [Gossypium darwinii]|uniref:Pectinesterase inhibitor domain-containing protein n=1 Tax=Gossypium darwinii TaxID=34276 RepID=A0A5D2DGD6_GOSDA|nr:hypothetical protein ES288_D02G240300v1 [Gossypium darwinii]